MKVAICICTYRRPKGLARLLQGLSRLCFRKVSAPAVELVIVDNTAEGMMRDFCEKAQRDYRWPIRYEIEPCRGISYARNRAIQSVREGTDFVAFIDDDEVPEPSWLDELLYVQGAYHADVVGGPTLGIFEKPVASWLIGAKFFGTDRYPTGKFLKEAYAGNVLIRRDILSRLRVSFDSEYALTGREDLMFFSNIYALGGKLIWADDAVVCEYVPESRTNIKWILRRAYSLGNGRMRVEMRKADSSLKKTIFFAQAVWRALRNSITLLFVAVRGEKLAVIVCLREVFKAFGRMTAIWGVSFKEYQATYGE